MTTRAHSARLNESLPQPVAAWRLFCSAFQGVPCQAARLPPSALERTGDSVAAVPPGPCRVHPMTSRWKHSILEVVESEKAYVKDLRVIIECFLDPLSAMFKVTTGELAKKSRVVTCLGTRALARLLCHLCARCLTACPSGGRPRRVSVLQCARD